VIRLTSGGERLDAQLVSAIRRMFPNAKLTNIYAATETGTLLVSHDDCFVVPDELRDRIQIIDGELWLDESLKVSGAKRDTSSERRDATGDLVEVVCEEPLTIRFVGRKHEWFNVAGFRVDPLRLEAIACSHPSVAQARFYGVPNSVTENIVGCELVLKTKSDSETLNVEDWKNWFSQQVERFEVPRLIRLLDFIETTPSGKVKRE
jgi:acyl-coenzyme A synthetase/AMP-(fatty) acid ligase